MRKSNIQFHAKRSSGRNAITIGIRRARTDLCSATHGIVNSKATQLMQNSLLTGLLDRGGVFA